MKKIGPAASVFLLFLFIAVTVILFTARGVALPGYTPPQNSSYYRAHPEELAAELEEHLLPLAELGSVTVTLENGLITFSGTEADVRAARQYAIHYYDPALFAPIS
ncbi:MAG: hypothetical protein ACSW8F_02005 [bacterium]